MSETEYEAQGPDFSEGVELSRIPLDGMLAGHVGGESVLLVRRAGAVFAIGGSCTHYGGPLSEGLVVGDTVRCPWHHACFSLRTGEALRAPALDPLPCWNVQHQGDRIQVMGRLGKPTGHEKQVRLAPGAPMSIVIVGGGAAGNAAAETLRHEGYTGRITVLSADSSAPYDRPNLSKAYLAGTAPEAYIPLRPPDFYHEQDIDLRLNARAVSLNTASRSVALADGSEYSFDALLLATGAEPVRLNAPGADLPHVCYLRTLADCRALISRASGARRAAVLGASFIGLEVAAALRTRGINVDVVAPESLPMERLLGADAGRFFLQLHEQHGAVFHLGRRATSISSKAVVLDNGQSVDADLVVAGIGVRPACELAEQSGIETHDGVIVDRYLETSVPGIFAAGDMARWPDRRSGAAIRVEHWVVAERMGQVAARNMLGRKESFETAPFFWTEQYDCTLAYSGHAEKWDEARLDGTFKARDCAVTYFRDCKELAMATIGRDTLNLEAEKRFETAS